MLAGLLVMVSLFALAACGKSSLSGRYVILDILDDPDGTTFTELDEMYKAEDLILTDFVYMEFLSGGRFVIVLFGEEEAKGTYTRSRKVITFIAEGQTFDAAISGKKITYNYETGAKLVFKKAKG